ncbi:MAG: tRNA uridine(34) 5-carboxymethylaminomethyl modification radical SAM/GNAT enzyme Elp3 [Patescibacteria group bacterium]|nr:tRNA uridine(34) 5-carboxymethylaminomethyl modification radical SAM/GNAT enzyme Elp3 [Patescibacteria group bacterium]
MDSLAQIIIKKAVEEDVRTAEEFLKVKKQVHKENKGFKFPTNISLLKAYKELTKKGEFKEDLTLEELLKTKKMRSLSGVSIITVLTKPYPCPGKCIYCPNEKGVPKSYLKDEPAVMRAILCSWNPKRQVQARLKSLKNQGHAIDKIELIVIGGTFSYLPKNYQESYIKSCIDALNGKISKDLIEAQKLNEKSKHRLVGLTLETRPDYINKKEVGWFRYLGATRVELGIQSLDDKILRLNRRGHLVKETVLATKLLKNTGFKVCYHMMPNLYGSDLNKDFKMFQKLFEKEDFRPDYLKIYPCMVIKGTELFEIFRKSEYKSYSDLELFNLLKKIKQIIPYYVRLKRLVRDIPAQTIVSGSKLSNLRQILEDDKNKNDWACKCIRCREVKGEKPKNGIKLWREDYKASGGKEVFLSFENKDRSQLYSLLRLRITNNQFLPELKKAVLIRELHTYGQEIPVGEKEKFSSQHKGLGKKLIEEAEKIAREEFSLKKIAVISGVGVRDYYRKLGYKLAGTYMVKHI